MIKNPGMKAFLFCLASWICLLCQILPIQQADPDLWGAMSVGAIYDYTGQIPTHDYFSFTAFGKPWIYHEWLSGIIFYTLAQNGGEAGLMVFKYLAMLAMLAVVFMVHRQYYNVSPKWGFYALTLLSPLYIGAFIPSVRCHFFTFLGFLLFLWILEAVRLQKKPPLWLLLLIPIGYAWGQAHGGYVVGLIVIGLYGLDNLVTRRLTSRARYLYWLLPVSIALAIAFINPYGPIFIEYLLTGLFIDRFLIPEWQPIPLFNLEFLHFKLVILFTLLVIGKSLIEIYKRSNDSNLLAHLRSLPIGPILVLLMVIAMSFKALRFNVFLYFALAMYLPLFFSGEHGKSPGFGLGWIPTTGKIRQGINALGGALPPLLTLTAIIALVFLAQTMPLLEVRVPDGREIARVYEQKYTVGHTLFLKQSGLSGNIITPFSQGQFMFWNLYPRFRVSMDGRYETLYPQEQFTNEFLFFYADPGHRLKSPQQYVDDLKADFVLFPNNSPTMQDLMANGQWKLLYADRLYFLVGRNSKAEELFKAPVHLKEKALGEWYTLNDFFHQAELDRFDHYGP